MTAKQLFCAATFLLMLAMLCLMTLCMSGCVSIPPVRDLGTEKKCSEKPITLIKLCQPTPKV